MKVEQGKKVEIFYTVTVDGEVVEASSPGKPLSYIHGHRQLLPSIQRHLEGRKIGDICDFVLQPREAYGEPKPEAYEKVSYDQLPPREQLKIGMILQEDQTDGRKKIGRVVQMTDEGVLLSFDHPMAGKTLYYHVEIKNIE